MIGLVIAAAALVIFTVVLIARSWLRLREAEAEFMAETYRQAARLTAMRSFF